MSKKIISPYAGGCWYCHTQGGSDLVFSREWDTLVHLDCIRNRLKEKPDCEEAHIFARELMREEFKEVDL